MTKRRCGSGRGISSQFSEIEKKNRTSGADLLIPKLSTGIGRHDVKRHFLYGNCFKWKRRQKPHPSQCVLQHSRKSVLLHDKQIRGLTFNREPVALAVELHGTHKVLELRQEVGQLRGNKAQRERESFQKITCLRKQKFDALIIGIEKAATLDFNQVFWGFRFSKDS